MPEDHLFKAATDDFRERPFLARSNLLGASIELIRDLYLGLYHDGNLPSWRSDVKEPRI
jgi:hypothetical protein